MGRSWHGSSATVMVASRDKSVFVEVIASPGLTAATSVTEKLALPEPSVVTSRDPR